MKRNKAILAALVAVIMAAPVVWSQYTPGTREGIVDLTYTNEWSVYFDDFYSAGYVANAADTNTAGLVALKGGKFSETADHAEWLVSVTDGDSDEAETIVAGDDGGSGWLEITTNNKAADDVEVQKNGEAFAITANRDLWYEARLKLEDIDQDTAFWGLTVSDTDILGSLGNDFIGFHYTATTNLAFKHAKNGNITTNTAVTTLADDTAKLFGFYVDGSAGDITVYVDGTSVATVTGSTNVPNDEALSPAFCMRTGDTGADTMSIDWLRITQTR